MSFKYYCFSCQYAGTFVAVETVFFIFQLNEGLRRLNVSWNGLGKEGCIALAKSLPKNDTLVDLDITCNRIDVVGLPFLLHGLVRNSGLERLNVSISLYYFNIIQYMF